MRPARRGMPLWLAITLALIVKLLILMMLHKAFFSAPQAKKMRMPSATVEQHLLGHPSTVPATKATP
jgi:hypothetical protein